MEQQKVLWIIFSVTLFLLVVVVVGFVWFLPPDDASQQDPELASGVTESAAILDPIQWVREDEETPGISEDPEEGDILLVYGEADEPESAPETTVTETAPVVSVVETAPTRTTRPAEAAPERTTTTSAPTTASTAAPTSTSAPRVTTPATTTSTTSRPAVTQAAAAAPTTERITQYWIQAGSYKSQSRAENTRETLSSKGWSSRIVSRDVSGELYFRVRLGPYQTQAEAQKFLTWLKDLDTFEASYISQVYSSRALN